MGMHPTNLGAGSAVSSIKDVTDNLAQNKIISGTSPGTGNTATRIELDGSASGVDGAYDPAAIYIIAGTGAGQSRMIFEYDGTNRYAYVSRDWKVTPDATSEYVIVYNSGNTHVNEGVAQAGTNNTITMNALASAQNNIYLGQMIFIVAGTGADQARMIVGYNGGTKIATVDSDWIVNPDSTSVYVTQPFPGFIHGLPATNSTANILIRDGIGTKQDFVGVPYNFGDNSILAFLTTGYYHVHGQSFCYPTTAVSVAVTSGAGAWTAGAITQVVPAGALTVAAFDLHWINIIDHTADAEYYIEILAGGVGSEVVIGATRSWRDSTFFGGQIANTTKRIQIPQQPSGTRISCRSYSSNAGAATVSISFEGHYYA